MAESQDISAHKKSKQSIVVTHDSVCSTLRFFIFLENEFIYKFVDSCVNSCFEVKDSCLLHAKIKPGEFQKREHFLRNARKISSSFKNA